MSETQVDNLPSEAQQQQPESNQNNLPSKAQQQQPESNQKKPENNQNNLPSEAQQQQPESNQKKPENNQNNLPSEAQELPEGAQNIFRAAFKSAQEDGLSEAAAQRVAWNSVKNEYEQGNEGKWQHKPDASNANYKAVPSGGN